MLNFHTEGHTYMFGKNMKKINAGKMVEKLNFLWFAHAINALLTTGDENWKFPLWVKLA